MKQVLIAIILLLLIVIVFQTCWYRKHCIDAGSVKPGAGFCANAACSGSSQTELKGLILQPVARRMAELYANDLGKKYVWDKEVRTDSFDAKSIWFDLKRLKSFIGYIEASLCADSCLSTDHYGIRIYYAKYPDTTEMKNYRDLDDVPREYANHHTVFMVPTYWDEQRKTNIDFDPMQRVNNCQLAPIDTTTKEIFGPYFKTEGSGSQQQNHGSLMPPPAGGGNYPQN